MRTATALFTLILASCGGESAISSSSDPLFHGKPKKCIESINPCCVKYNYHVLGINNWQVGCQDGCYAYTILGKHRNTTLYYTPECTLASKLIEYTK